MTLASWRISTWSNTINPTSYKVVIVAYCQVVAIAIFWLGWLVDIVICVVRNQPTDFHETSVGLVLGFLGALSGVNTYGRKVERESDYEYMRIKNAGKAIDASAPPQAPQVVTGDNAQVTATMPAQTVAPRTSAAVPVQRVSVAQQSVDVLPPDDDGIL